MGTQCPEGYTYCNGACYKNCPQGYTSDCKGNCLSECPAGWRDLGNGRCQKPAPYTYKNVGFDTQAECGRVSGACYQCGGKYYPVCLSDYKPINCNRCGLVCPDGSVNNDESCGKVSIENEPPIPPELSWSTIFIILSLVILAITIFIQIITTNQDVTSDMVFDDQFGTPGHSDAYAIITGQRVSNREIYV